MFDRFASTINLGAIPDEDKIRLKGNSEIKRKVSDIIKRSRADAKNTNCYVCGKKVDSFCNSHSVPAFCLRNISDSGDVLTLNTIVDNPFLETEKGIKKAGTFQIIWRECDSKIFSDYENSENYSSIPTGKMIAQIALKNSLKAISKRQFEIEFYRIAQEMTGKRSVVFEQKTDVSKLDLFQYNNEFRRAKKALEKDDTSAYYICYYERLPYVVPIAFQSAISLVFDFEGNIINEIYNKNEQHLVKDINICVFPMKSDSIIIMFTDDGDTRYRRFYKQFRKLPLEDKLSAITFIMFAYSEEAYFSKSIKDDVENSQKLCDAGKSGQDILSLTRFVDPYVVAKQNFDLSKRRDIPNLLSEKYKIR